MKWKQSVLVVSLLLAWTGQWVLNLQSQRLQTAQSLAALLGSEVQIGLETRPFQPGPALSRLQLLPDLQGAELLAADHTRLWSFGEGPFEESQAVAESGQLLANLRLHYAAPRPPMPLAVGWLASLALCLWSRAGRGARSLVLEVDAQRRIRRLSGSPELLVGEGRELVGQSLDELLHGPQTSGRTLSQLAGSSSRSLVVVRDSQDVRKVRRRLKQLELQYRHLCDGAHDLIAILEPEGNLVFVNRSLHNLTGTPQQFEQLFRPDCWQRVRARLHDALLDGKCPEFEAELQRPNGQTVPVSGTLTCAEIDSGSPLTVLAIFRDLSAQRVAEARLMQAQKMEAVGLLASGVAHDYNNFLCLFSGLAGLIRCDLDQREQVEHYLNELEQGLDAAADLTRQLLHFGRKKNSDPQKFPLDQAVADFSRMASRLLGRQVALETNLQSRAELLGDRTQLEQVVLNLLVNARDAMPEGGQIRLSTSILEGMAELRVSDQGSGMPSEVAARIFEPYFTTKEPGKGTGLGLSTVYAIVTGWGGELTVESEPERGTTFKLRFPLA
ncbi:hypothetical protein ABS71_17205 [bacterium SCN 62-11]|nr:PAS domain-containing protein [Candidatus Eremiobacteraeota bacterium]ODT60670.1 MAG: hypothetical protein ABS71_17205 [bacterium SCN 62-11]